VINLGILSISYRTRLVFVLLALSFFVYNLAGYNYFLDSSQRNLVKLLAPVLVFLGYKLVKDESLKRVFYGFFSISIGFLVAWLLVNVPGYFVSDLDTVMGWGVSKFFEALPICVSVYVLGSHGESFTTLGLRGGNVMRSLGYGLVASVLGFVQYLVMVGFVFRFTFSQLVSWTPWLVLFASSNAMMEELIFRGLFLGNYTELLGGRVSLLLISFVFALFHGILLPFMGLSVVIIFVCFLFLQGYVWGFIFKKTGSLWGSVLAHAVADILFTLAVFSG
jgi:membrane protease YdiL (CAAX protease family)